MYQLYESMMNNIQQKQDFSMMNPMHTVLSGMKALFCGGAYEGIKVIRECCGAAGFSQLSSIPNIIDLISSYVTLEGDYVVMNL